MKNTLNETPFGELFGHHTAVAGYVPGEDLKHKNVLDIGCGFGWFEAHALNQEVAKIVALDISDADLATARKHIVDPRATFVVGSAIDLRNIEGHLDTIVSWEVIEHIPKNTEHMMFSETFRLLRPGGVFYLSTPYYSVASNILDPAWWLIGHRHYKPAKLADLASKAGFEVESTTVRGGWFAIWRIINLYVCKWIFRRKPLFDNYFSRKATQEYQREGFANLFMKFRKPPFAV